MNKKNYFTSSQTQFRIKTTMVFLALVVLFLTLAPPVLAIETGLGFGTITGLGTQDIRITIMKIVRIILGFVGVIAISIIIYAGYIWMTSAGNSERIEKAKKILINAVIGLLIILSAFAIVSFIINALQGAVGRGQPPLIPPPGGCQNCGYLGGGIIESVYPAPLATDVPRDTVIIVTFKEEINPETIIAGYAPGAICTQADDCLGNLAVTAGLPNIRIYKKAEGEFNTSQDPPVFNALGANEVRVTSEDMKTYIFSPIAPLGDSTTKHWYTTKLTNSITKDNDDESAFPGVKDFFSWDFEIGTKLDLVPPYEDSVFPIPDDRPDQYSSS